VHRAPLPDHQITEPRVQTDLIWQSQSQVERGCKLPARRATTGTSHQPCLTAPFCFFFQVDTHGSDDGLPAQGADDDVAPGEADDVLSPQVCFLQRAHQPFNVFKAATGLLEV
jgi:hypothetical protein